MSPCPPFVPRQGLDHLRSVRMILESAGVRLRISDDGAVFLDQGEAELPGVTETDGEFLQGGRIACTRLRLHLQHGGELMRLP